MPWNDDDDVEDDPLSTRGALERADHRKGEKKDELRKKKEAQKSREKLKRDLLVKQVHGSVILQKDDAAPQKFGPKTVEQKAGKQYQPTAEQDVQQEQLMDAADEAKKAEDESKQEQSTASPG